MTSNYHIRWPEYGIFITAEHSIRHSCRHSLHVLWALFLTLLTLRYSKYFHLTLLLRKPNLRNDLAKFMNRASGRVKHNFKLVCFISRRTSLYHVSWSQFLIMKPPLSKSPSKGYSPKNRTIIELLRIYSQSVKLQRWRDKLSEKWHRRVRMLMCKYTMSQLGKQALAAVTLYLIGHNPVMKTSF